MASLVALNEESAKGKLDRLWAQLSHHRSGGSRSYPSHFEVYREICGGSDYGPVLKCPFDTRHEARSNGFQLSEARSLCPNGAVAKCKLEVFAGSPYTGVFGSGAEHCIVRLSTAIKPPDALGAELHPEAYAASFASYLSQKMKRAVIGGQLQDAQLFPCVAIKALRDGPGVPSANILLAGSKTGQTESDFFEHCVCTNLTQKVSMALRPVVNAFHAWSEHPLSLGLSECAAVDANGQRVSDHELKFPYCLVLRPVPGVLGAPVASVGRAFDTFLDDLLTGVPAGTALYDIFACPSPEV